MSDFCELLVYGPIPLMHLVHCPFRAGKKLPGNGYGCQACKDVPCFLRDRTGTDFPILSIRLLRCQSVLLNSVPLDLSQAADRLPWVGSWRMDFYSESPENVAFIVNRFQAVSNGETVPAYPHAYTTGHYLHGVD